MSRRAGAGGEDEGCRCRSGGSQLTDAALSASLGFLSEASLDVDHRGLELRCCF